MIINTHIYITTHYFDHVEAIAIVLMFLLADFFYFISDLDTLVLPLDVLNVYVLYTKCSYKTLL